MKTIRDVIADINFNSFETKDVYIRIAGKGDIAVLSKNNTQDFNDNTILNILESFGDIIIESYSIEPNDFNSTVINIKL